MMGSRPRHHRKTSGTNPYPIPQRAFALETDLPPAARVLERRNGRASPLVADGSRQPRGGRRGGSWLLLLGSGREWKRGAISAVPSCNQRSRSFIARKEKGSYCICTEQKLHCVRLTQSYMTSPLSSSDSVNLG